MGLVNVLEVGIFYTLSRLLALGCRDTVVFGRGVFGGITVHRQRQDQSIVMRMRMETM